MRAHTRFSITVIAAAAAFAVGARADAPNIYAIRGARLVTAAGAPVQSGTIVIRNGAIEAVGADVQAPADAFVIDGAGMTVYPGLIDMGNSTGTDIQSNPNPPGTFRTSEDQERWKRSVIFRPEMVAADHLQADAPELSRYASAGVTTVLAIPPGSLVKGQSALVNVAAPADEPQIGAVADTRKGLQVVRTPVALHVALNASGGRGGYPASLMGSIAFVRQHFLDAQHQQLAQQQYERSKTGGSRPAHDASLDALQPALARRLPVVFEADLSREILRSLNMAKEFNLDPVITGAAEADQVAADLKAQNARVIYNLNYPVRSRALPPDADESLRELQYQGQRAEDPRRTREGRSALRVLSRGHSRTARFRPQRGSCRQGRRPVSRRRRSGADDQRREDCRRRRTPRIARTRQDRQRHRDRWRSVRGKDPRASRVRRRVQGECRGAASAGRPRARWALSESEIGNRTSAIGRCDERTVSALSDPDCRFPISDYLSPDVVVVIFAGVFGLARSFRCSSIFSRGTPFSIHSGAGAPFRW